MKKRELGWLVSAPFFGVHVAAVVGVALLGWSWTGFALAMGLYFVRMFGVTGAYHRYFSHRTYRTSRWFQLALAVLAQSSLQKGALWWAAHHRNHHRHADTPADPHSPAVHGFWWSHAGWFLTRGGFRTDWARIPDLARYPELRWLDRYDTVVPVLLAARPSCVTAGLPAAAVIAREVAPAAALKVSRPPEKPTVTCVLRAVASMAACTSLTMSKA